MAMTQAKPLTLRVATTSPLMHMSYVHTSLRRNTSRINLVPVLLE